MGYGTRSGSLGHTIRTFQPDDDESTMYVNASSFTSLEWMLDRAKEKWGNGIDLSRIEISAQHIHTDCLGYDLYDPGDYEDFIILRNLGPAVNM